MNNVLILAKKFINKFKKSRKFRILVAAMAVKLLFSVLALIIISYLAYEPLDAGAAYGTPAPLVQVKTADNPTVYYLDHKRGLKKAYVSGAAFLSYGNKWSDVKIISSEELSKWPEIRLIKIKNSNRVYYINNGQKALIESEQQFMDYGFNWNEIVTVSETDFNGYKPSAFDDIKAALFDNGAMAANNRPQNGLLKINLAPLDSSSFYIPTGSRGNVVAVFNFEALGRDVKISGLTFTQQGVSSDEVISSAYLTDQAGNIYGDKYGLTNKHLYLNLNAQPIIISAGEYKTFYLKVDLNPVSGATGQTVRFGILSQIDVNGGEQVAGTFPLSGPEWRLVDGVKNLGKLRVVPLTLRADGSEVSIGSNNKAVAALRLAETSGNEDILIKKIILTNIGSAQDGDLRNLALIDQDGITVMKAQTMVGGKLNFIFEPGLLIKKNHYIDLTLKTAVAGGDGRDIKFVVENDSDIAAVSKANDYGLAVTSDRDSGNANRFAINRAPVFLASNALKNGKQLVYKNQNDAVLGSFELRNNTSDIKLSSFTLSVVKSAGAPVLDQSITAVDAKTGAILGAVAPEKIINNFAEINLGNREALKSKALKINFLSHIPDTARGGDSYQVLVKSVNYHIAENNILYSDNMDLSGQKIEVIRPAVYLYPGVPDKNDLAVAGDEKVIVGFFKVEATDESDIRLTDITITGAAGFTPVNYANGFTNLALYKGGSRVSDYIAEPNENSYVFNNLKIFVGAGSSADIYVKADLAANAAGMVKLFMENAAAESYASKIPAEVNNKNIAGPEIAITRTVVRVAAQSGGSIARGQKNNRIASFIFTNDSAEKIRLNKAIINSGGFTGNLSNNNGFSNLRFGYLDAKNRIVSVGSRASKPVADVNEISLGGFTLDPGENQVLSLFIDADKDAAAGSISLFIRDVQAKGSISGMDASVSGAPTDEVMIGAN